MTNEFMELFERKEPLREELVPYLHDGPVGKMIHHPLVIDMFLDPERSALVNKSYEVKVAAVAEAMIAKNWHSYIFLHERPYRIEALATALAHEPDDPAALVGAVWIDSENIRQHKKLWEEIWANLDHPNDAMNDDEKDAYASLPSVIKVYRGIREPHYNRRGMAWTIDRDKAEWFAKRWKGKRPTVLEGEIKKEKVLAFFTGRGEKEIVAMPKDVKLIKRDE